MAYTTIDNGKDYFNTLTWSGNSANRSITGVGFSPDWVWIKCRSDSAGHVAFDTVRGASKRLVPNASAGDTTTNEYGFVTAFGSDGFTVTGGNQGGYAHGDTNLSGRTYVGWNWRGSDSNAVSNTDGTNASTVSVNQTAGFSIVSYTRDGNSTTTVGHGLGKTPKVKIEKDRDTDSTNWSFITSATGSDQYGFLNTTDTFGSTTSGFTSTVFRSAMGANQGDIIAYVFAEIEGYSKFGSYEGNGSDNGTFVYTGFKPAFILMKNIDAAENWLIYDNKRDPENVISEALLPNSGSATGGSSNAMDLLSNGFKLRQSAGSLNGSNKTFIYMAFAEHPFVSSEGVPVTAR